MHFNNNLLDESEDEGKKERELIIIIILSDVNFLLFVFEWFLCWYMYVLRTNYLWLYITTNAAATASKTIIT